ncbi:MAG: Ig-like domain-containing protein, partial [Patescibacteria group bacterium]|nr:Ig-like domain-containing protein [Patescibacteria group bacterium]
TAILKHYIKQGSALEIEIQGTDLDLDPLQYGTGNTIPSGASFDSLHTHKFTWIPTFSDSGTKQIIFLVRDDRGGIGRDTTTIQVQFTNQYPVMGALADSYFVNVNDSLKFRITATDGDRDSIIYSVSGLPDGAQFLQATTQEFKWIPNFYQSGTYQVTFNVSDGRGGVAYKKVYIIVNQPPKFQTIENRVINEGDTLRLIAKAQDLDRDSLTLTVSNLPAGATVTNFRDSVRIVWNTNFSSSGFYTVMFIAADKKRGRDTLRVQITVNNVNRKPVFVAISQQSVNVGNTLQFTITANDSDQNALQYSALRLPTGATFDSLARLFRWTPVLSQIGRDTARFQVSDNLGGKDTLRVPVLIVNQNFAPAIVPTGTKRIAEGSELIFAVVATDVNGDTLKYSISGSPQGAQFDTTVRPAPIFRWKPSYTQAGLYTVIFISNDGKGGIGRDTVRITVTNLNQAPVLNFAADSTISEGTSLQLNLRASDPDNDPIQVTVSPAAPDGSVIQKIGTNFIFSWTPSYRQAGNYTLTFTARDTSDSSASKVLQLKVLNVNRTPSRPTVIYPKKGEVLASDNFLIWQRSYDPDNDDSLYYRIEFDNDSTFRSPDLTVQQLIIDTIGVKILYSIRSGQR